MVEPIYSSEEHKAIVQAYIFMSKEFVKEVSTKAKYNSYLKVLDVIIEYHNGYGSGVKENEWYTWLMIIPINLSVMTNGFFAGIENKNNSTLIHSYKIILEELVHDVADKIDNLKSIHE